MNQPVRPLPGWRTVLGVCVSTVDQVHILSLTAPQAGLFAPPANRSARLQRVVFSTRVLISEGSVAIPLLPVNRRLGLLDRIRRRFNPTYRLGPSPQGGT